jgi:hypothetical protein
VTYPASLAATAISRLRSPPDRPQPLRSTKPRQWQARIVTAVGATHVSRVSLRECVVTTYEPGDLRADVRVKSHWLLLKAVKQIIRADAHNAYGRVSEGGQTCAVRNDNNGSLHGEAYAKPLENMIKNLRPRRSAT